MLLKVLLAPIHELNADLPSNLIVGQKTKSHMPPGFAML